MATLFAISSRSKLLNCFHSSLRFSLRRSIAIWVSPNDTVISCLAFIISLFLFTLALRISAQMSLARSRNSLTLFSSNPAPCPSSYVLFNQLENEGHLEVTKSQLPMVCFCQCTLSCCLENHKRVHGTNVQ